MGGIRRGGGGMDARGGTTVMGKEKADKYWPSLQPAMCDDMTRTEATSTHCLANEGRYVVRSKYSACLMNEFYKLFWKGIWFCLPCWSLLPMGASKEAVISCSSYFLVVLQTGKQWKTGRLAAWAFCYSTIDAVFFFFFFF